MFCVTCFRLPTFPVEERGTPVDMYSRNACAESVSSRQQNRRQSLWDEHTQQKYNRPLDCVFCRAGAEVFLIGWPVHAFKQLL